MPNATTRGRTPWTKRARRGDGQRGEHAGPRREVLRRGEHGRVERERRPCPRPAKSCGRFRASARALTAPTLPDSLAVRERRACDERRPARRVDDGVAVAARAATHRRARLAATQTSGSATAVSFVSSASAKKPRCSARSTRDERAPSRRKKSHAASANTASSESLRPGIHATAAASAGCTAKTSAASVATRRGSAKRRSTARRSTLASAWSATLVR